MQAENEKVEAKVEEAEFQIEQMRKDESAAAARASSAAQAAKDAQV